MKKYKNKIVAAIIIIFALVIGFMHGEDLSETTDTGAQRVPSVVTNNTPDENLGETKRENLIKDIEQPKANNTNVRNDVIEDVPTENTQETVPALTCTMSVNCEAILENIDKLKSEKHGLVPRDGVIYYAKPVEFNEGESAFDLLLREMRNNNIHIEFEYTPAFDSTYIEGIGNLYEFDCGDMSGWLYKVNGKPADCGSSQYILSPGDIVEWVYTCG